MTQLSKYASRILYAASALLLVAALASTAMNIMSVDRSAYPENLLWMNAAIVLEYFFRQVGWAAVAFGLAAIVERMDREAAE